MSEATKKTTEVVEFVSKAAVDEFIRKVKEYNKECGLPMQFNAGLNQALHVLHSLPVLEVEADAEYYRKVNSSNFLREIC